ncbi:MAG: hypothetical protein EG824_03705 [Deltaproteobacteria bacterium]|nr:hypothetical protein [Deltaproteobacteria bacterium]
MKGLLLILALTVVLFGAATIAAEAAESPKSGLNEQVSVIQEKMLNDPELMGLVLALQSDPEVQALLNDPSVLNAISSGDITALTGNPRVMRLLENARVKEIQKRLEQ